MGERPTEDGEVVVQFHSVPYTMAQGEIHDYNIEVHEATREHVKNPNSRTYEAMNKAINARREKWRELKSQYQDLLQKSEGLFAKVQEKKNVKSKSHYEAVADLVSDILEAQREARQINKDARALVDSTVELKRSLAKSLEIAREKKKELKK